LAGDGCVGFVCFVEIHAERKTAATIPAVTAAPASA
jgi:hypothetical protein